MKWIKDGFPKHNINLCIQIRKQGQWAQLPRLVLQVSVAHRKCRWLPFQLTSWQFLAQQEDPVFWIYFDQQGHVVGVLEMRTILGERLLIYWRSELREIGMQEAGRQGFWVLGKKVLKLQRKDRNVMNWGPVALTLNPYCAVNSSGEFCSLNFPDWGIIYINQVYRYKCTIFKTPLWKWMWTNAYAL